MSTPTVTILEQDLLPLETTAATQHNTVAKTLVTKLNEQCDLVIDFSSLKACLNPLGIGDDKSQEQVNKVTFYEDLVSDLIEKQAEKLPNLEKLTVRRLQKSSKPLKDEEFDRYAHINHGIMQMSCLTELDLSNLPKIFHDQLQLWNLHNLKTLSITKSELQSFPGSVGRLAKLENLDLSSNWLTSLPVTLAFCKNLKTLDVHYNRFKQLPGVILRLPNLTTLRRLLNPLTPRYECQGPHYTRKDRISSYNTKTKKVYQPISLQASCTTVIFSSKVDYWGTDCIGPLQCKTLDRLATQFTICDNCDRMLPDEANRHNVEVMLVTFMELSGVPFYLKGCSEACQNELMKTYGQKNIELQEKLDSEYDESIRQVQKEMGMEDCYVPRPHQRHGRRTTRRRKRCSIM